VTEHASHQCPRCGTGVEPAQEYCLECGIRLERQSPGPVDRAAASVAARHPWARAWAIPAALGLVVAVLGGGAAIAISGDSDESASPSTAIGGSLTATDDTSTLTPPEPTVPATSTTVPATSAPAKTTTPKPPGDPAAVSWPAKRRGWTVVLLSLPQANGRASAEAKAKEARADGLRNVGVLDSSRFANLHPGYYVVFTGVFGTEAEASTSLQRARAVFPVAYQREIVP